MALYDPYEERKRLLKETATIKTFDDVNEGEYIHIVDIVDNTINFIKVVSKKTESHEDSYYDMIDLNEVEHKMHYNSIEFELAPLDPKQKHYIVHCYGNQTICFENDYNCVFVTMESQAKMMQTIIDAKCAYQANCITRLFNGHTISHSHYHPDIILG